MLRTRALYVLAVVLLICGSIAYVLLLSISNTYCGEPLGPAKVSQLQLPSIQFSGITKFRIPNKVFPNGITAVSDGSVWFGEQDPPGVAHLYTNGTLMQYRWSTNYSATSIWGVAVWRGRIWIADAMGGQIVTLDPNTSTVSAIKLSNIGAFPYTLTVGMDDALWFTELYGSKLARIDAQCKLTEYPVPTYFGGTPTQIQFVNATYGYYVDAGNATNGRGEVLAFSTTSFNPQPIGGGFRPLAASSLALTPKGLWVTQHASSNLAFYDFQTHSWTQYPTTPVDYVESTLPYFVAANESLVWFNEHYGNRLAMIDPSRGLLTEYSLSNPPANKTSQIDNALTFALSANRVWFTELTAEYVGYLNSSYQPDFDVSPVNQHVRLMPGENISLGITVNRPPSEPLTISIADNENFTSQPNKIEMNAELIATPSTSSTETVVVWVSANRTLLPGDYVLLVTVSNGLVNRGVYVWLTVGVLAASAPGTA